MSVPDHFRRGELSRAVTNGFYHMGDRVIIDPGYPRSRKNGQLIGNEGIVPDMDRGDLC